MNAPAGLVHPSNFQQSPMSDTIVRPLAASDTEAYIRLRREMLADSPWAFAASPEDDFGLDPALLTARLAEPGQAIVGAFDGSGRLVGATGVYRDRHRKMSHRARIWGVYVTPVARGRGLGARIMSAAMDIARSWPGITSAGLSVSVRSEEARRLYERLGFKPWGVEPGALMLDGRAYDEIHMVAFLDAHRTGR
jgi:RimJ/RimL family protein N-acetyltransferase